MKCQASLWADLSYPAGITSYYGKVIYFIILFTSNSLNLRLGCCPLLVVCGIQTLSLVCFLGGLTGKVTVWLISCNLWLSFGVPFCFSPADKLSLLLLYWSSGLLVFTETTHSSILLQGMVTFIVCSFKPLFCSSFLCLHTHFHLSFIHTSLNISLTNLCMKAPKWNTAFYLILNLDDKWNPICNLLLLTVLAFDT